MPGDDRLAGLLVAADQEGGILFGEAVRGRRRACPGRPWSSARWRTEITGAGKVIDSSWIGALDRRTGCRRWWCS